MRVYVCFGSTKAHLQQLEAAAAGDDSLGWWTVNLSALPKDRAVFYMVGPTSAFVATGVIAEKPWILNDESSGWHGRYVAEITGIRMLSRPALITEAKKMFPQWSYQVCSDQTLAIERPLMESRSWVKLVAHPFLC